MFDISTQSLLKLMRKWRITIVKIYGNEDQISEHHHGPNFLCFFNLWVWEFSVKRWQLICLKTLLRFSFISCFKSTIFVIVCLLNTYHSFLWRENPKILLENLNNQKKILKDNGIDVDDKNVPSTNCWWVFILKLLLFRVETTVMVYCLKDWTPHIYLMHL